MLLQHLLQLDGLLRNHPLKQIFAALNGFPRGKLTLGQPYQRFHIPWGLICSLSDVTV
jgi:hypothetical protein